MTLPKLSLAKYKVIVPSTGEEHYFVPFLVKQQKTLLVAMQFGEAEGMSASLCDVLTECFEGKLDVSKLPFFDVIYLFTQIRAKSSGDSIEMKLNCNFCDNEDNFVKEELDLLSLEVEGLEKSITKIPLTDEVGLIMRYPTLRDILNDRSTPNEEVISVIVKYIDKIYTADEVIEASTNSKEELEEFVGNLTSGQLKEINKFFETLPNMRKEFEYQCPQCNKENKTTLEGIMDFFT